MASPEDAAVTQPLRTPIDWDDPYGTDWVAVQATLIYAPSFAHASFEVHRRPLAMYPKISKTGFWAELPETRPANAYESHIAIYRTLEQCTAEYWLRYKGRKK